MPKARVNLCERWSRLDVTYLGAAAKSLLFLKTKQYELPKGVVLGSPAFISALSCTVQWCFHLPRTASPQLLIYGSGTMGLIMLELGRLDEAAVFGYQIRIQQISPLKKL